MTKSVDFKSVCSDLSKQFYWCPFLKEEWVLECYVPWKTIAKLSYNEGGCLEAQKASKRIHGGVLVGVQGSKCPENF